jgi:hypothetical protein
LDDFLTELAKEEQRSLPQPHGSKGRPGAR